MHAHWMPICKGEGFFRTVQYVGVVREFAGPEPRAVAISPDLRALNAFRDGLGADGYAHEPMRDWRDRLLDDETRDIPAPFREAM